MFKFFKGKDERGKEQEKDKKEDQSTTGGFFNLPTVVKDNPNDIITQPSSSGSVGSTGSYGSRNPPAGGYEGHAASVSHGGLGNAPAVGYEGHAAATSGSYGGPTAAGYAAPNAAAGYEAPNAQSSRYSVASDASSQGPVTTNTTSPSMGGNLFGGMALKTQSSHSLSPLPGASDLFT